MLDTLWPQWISHYLHFLRLVKALPRTYLDSNYHAREGRFGHVDSRNESLARGIKWNDTRTPGGSPGCW